ncbi:DUF3168 domain-containing protein [uncultured Cohaesibacter sp.]|uniref:DUF3168 domain-containing protein n=1 Tax=uncultured Cohaesibacter sp. TaxID=1002546 RepID=UPI0029C8EDB7|nr:DUF3168 domain-containing protein [uncultured Cohaesibacter sp.]
MTLASRSLEQALFAHLKAGNDLITLLGGARLYDEPKRNSDLPYLTLATSYSRDWSTGSDKGEEHRLLLTVWTGTEDRALQQSILDCLSTLLADPSLSLTGHHLVNLTIERTDMRTDRKNRLLQGILQMRAVTEEPTT